MVRDLKGVSFCSRRYTKKVRFLLKTVQKGSGVATRVGLLKKTFLTTPGSTIYSGSEAVKSRQSLSFSNNLSMDSLWNSKSPFLKYFFYISMHSQFGLNLKKNINLGHNNIFNLCPKIISQ